MAADHGTIAKFSSENDACFLKVVRSLKRLVRDAKQKVDWNWKRWEADKEYYRPSHKASGSMFAEREFKVGISFNMMHNPHFIGREKILQHIDQKFRLPPDDRRLNLIVLYGTGGVGKTQNATKYAHQFKSHYTSMFWIDGSSNNTAEASMLAALEAIRRHYQLNKLQSQPWFTILEQTSLQSPPAHRVRQLQQNFLTWLSSDGNCAWLMVIDNLDDVESFDFRNWLPSTLCGSVLVTSRRPDLAQHWRAIEINPMAAEEAMSLLRQTSGTAPTPKSQEWNSSYQLIQALGCLPLAIIQAGAHIFMDPGGRSVSRYLDLFEKHPRELLASGAESPWDSKKDSVFTSLEISYATLQQRDPVATRILLLCGVISRRWIQEELFRSSNTTDLEVHRAFLLLISYSIFRKDSGNVLFDNVTTYWIHPIVHRWTRVRMEVKEQKSLARQAAAMLRDFRGGYQVFLWGGVGTRSPWVQKSILLFTNKHHARQPFSLYKEWYPCETNPRDVIHVPEVQPPALSQHLHRSGVLYSVQLWVQKFRGLVNEFWVSTIPQSLGYNLEEIRAWEDLYEMEVNMGEEGPNLAAWAICHALKRFPPKHPRILSMVQVYACHLEHFDSDQRTEARSWYWWLFLTRGEMYDQIHPDTAKIYLGLARTTDSCDDALTFGGRGVGINWVSLGLDDISTKSAIRELADVVEKCSSIAVFRNDVFPRFAPFWTTREWARGLISLGQTRGLMDLGSWQASLFFYLARTGDLEKARLFAPAGWNEFLMVAWRLFLMQSDFDDELKERLAWELFSVSEKLAEPAESVDSGTAIVDSLPFIVALHLMHVNPDRADDVILPIIPGLAPQSQPNSDRPKDIKNGWLLMPLTVPDADDSPNAQWSHDDLVQGAIKRLSTDRPWIFNWFGYPGTILLKLELTWAHHLRNWVVYRCDYVGMKNLDAVEDEKMTTAPGMSAFSPIHFFEACNENSYHLKDDTQPANGT
ncbi:eukaryotic translation initiation factor 3 [Fusarium mundagurra]|uniref:Eukaryotic translation initiation factor 3 n=1 Tax=Fusarium mundagurra TaxID=1567541 RepID=A0A8H5YTX8_9HYPO|nr:eukaryotic translation initiation factor 3 [Fusarium mundagurra]